VQAAIKDLLHEPQVAAMYAQLRSQGSVSASSSPAAAFVASSSLALPAASDNAGSSIDVDATLSALIASNHGAASGTGVNGVAAVAAAAAATVVHGLKYCNHCEHG
jgi:hypothetical protein